MVQLKAFVTSLLAGIAIATPIRIKLPTGEGWAVNFCQGEALIAMVRQDYADGTDWDKFYLKYVGGNSDPLASDCQVLGKFDNVNQHVGCIAGARSGFHGCDKAFDLNEGGSYVGVMIEEGTVCSFFHGSSCDAESKAEIRSYSYPYTTSPWKRIARPSGSVLEDGTLSFRCYYDKKSASAISAAPTSSSAATTPSTVKTPLGLVDATVSRIIVHVDVHTIEQDINHGDGVTLDPEAGHDFDPYAKQDIGHDYL